MYIQKSQLKEKDGTIILSTYAYRSRFGKNLDDSMEFEVKKEWLEHYANSYRSENLDEFLDNYTWDDTWQLDKKAEEEKALINRFITLLTYGDHVGENAYKRLYFTVPYDWLEDYVTRELEIDFWLFLQQFSLAETLLVKQKAEKESKLISENQN